MKKILVSILMGSKSDWSIMEEASLMLDKLQIPHEARALSAHRTPDALFEYLKSAEERGVQVFIAAAGGARTPAGARNFEIFFSQHHVFNSRLARSPGHLLRHTDRIILQERKVVQIDA